jgi:hypothetical protein
MGDSHSWLATVSGPAQMRPRLVIPNPLRLPRTCHPERSRGTCFFFSALSSRPEQAAFSAARSMCAACGAEGPWQDRTVTPTDLTDSTAPIQALVVTLALAPTPDNLARSTSSDSQPLVIPSEAEGPAFLFRLLGGRSFSSDIKPASTWALAPEESLRRTICPRGSSDHSPSPDDTPIPAPE